jgi:hypothetical protein
MQWAATGLKGLGLSDRTLELYEKSTYHPDATPADIRQAANELVDLGYDYHDRANALLSRLPR